MIASHSKILNDFNSSAEDSSNNVQLMKTRSLEYAFLIKHKLRQAGDEEKRELSESMLSATIKNIEFVISHSVKLRSGDELSGEGEYADYIDPPLTALTSPESLPYLPRDTPDRLADTALKAIEQLNKQETAGLGHLVTQHVLQRLLDYTDIVTDSMARREIKPEHLQTSEPITTRKPIILRTKANASLKNTGSL